MYVHKICRWLEMMKHSNSKGFWSKLLVIQFIWTSIQTTHYKLKDLKTLTAIPPVNSVSSWVLILLGNWYEPRKSECPITLNSLLVFDGTVLLHIAWIQKVRVCIISFMLSSLTNQSSFVYFCDMLSENKIGLQTGFNLICYIMEVVEL